MRYCGVIPGFGVRDEESESGITREGVESEVGFGWNSVSITQHWDSLERGFRGFTEYGKTKRKRHFCVLFGEGNLLQRSTGIGIFVFKFQTLEIISQKKKKKRWN
ncbi:hypothetical protein PanWU01x14_306080 [Parasponia andersonii]|uniref:Uncharacterized protein n=1 Tax=Parasponia andersonii TaxID=3476 RepID=A0A2P5ARX3_PARAD|nr:hypothetical protein PanWU01x14_306080 [Parasponia andersonii]